MLILTSSNVSSTIPSGLTDSYLVKFKEGWIISMCILDLPVESFECNLMFPCGTFRQRDLGALNLMWSHLIRIG